jgi:hypothetical protein
MSISIYSSSGCLTTDLRSMVQAMCKENALRCMEVLGESSENCHGLHIFLEMYMKLCDHHMISCLIVHIIGRAVTR